MLVEPAKKEKAVASRVEVFEAEDEEQDESGSGDGAVGLADVNGEGEREESTEPEETESQESIEGLKEEVSSKEDDGSLAVTIDDGSGDQSNESGESYVIRDFRKRFKNQQREIKELKERIAKSGLDAAPAVMQKPTLEGCDYDAEEFDKKLSAWHEQRVQQSLAEAEQRKALERQAADFQKQVDKYNAQKAALGAKDFDEAEENVKAVLGETKYLQIIDGADEPESIVYALAQHPEILSQLADMPSNNRFAWHAARLEKKIVKVKPKKPLAPPEKIPKGTASATGISESQLERLRAEAHRTGDFTELHNWQRKQRAAQER